MFDRDASTATMVVRSRVASISGRL